MWNVEWKCWNFCRTLNMSYEDRVLSTEYSTNMMHHHVGAVIYKCEKALETMEKINEKTMQNKNEENT